MTTYLGPLPAVGFNRFSGKAGYDSISYCVSGEITVTKKGLPAGIARKSGMISNVGLSVLKCGLDATNALKIAANVLINGTTCLTTQPSIVGAGAGTDNVGTTSENRTTLDTNDSGVVAAVMLNTANTVYVGDIITCDLTLTRTSSPTTEMANAVITIDFEPDSNLP